VLEGLALTDVVAVPLTGLLDAGSPAIAVSASVLVEDSEEDRDEKVAVAFCAPVITVAEMAPEKDVRDDADELLGWRDADPREEYCADDRCACST
jgi:hypothetical protein